MCICYIARYRTHSGGLNKVLSSITEYGPAAFDGEPQLYGCFPVGPGRGYQKVNHLAERPLGPSKTKG